MQNFTLYKNYSQISENYQLKLPIDLDVLIPEDDSVRLLSLMMEELDYKKLYEAYSPNGRNPAVPPKILFKILIYAYMNDIWSSRKIELACKRDVNFMWLLEGFKAPDHNTIARFRTGRLEPILDDLFNQFIVKLYENNELELKNLFIDGTKIEANANKYTFVWKKTVSNNEIKLGEAIKLFIKNKKALCLSIILTIIQLTVFFSISYCVYKAFNLNGLSLFEVLSLQVFLYMSVSPIPTPGNVGANEVAFLTIFANVFPGNIIGYSVFLYSIYVYYFLVVVCGLFTIHTHYHMNKRKNKNRNYNL